MVAHYNCIGTMSGTSLDGMDIALCSFTFENNHWNYSILGAETFPYSAQWKERLSSAENLSGLGLMLLHNDFGKLTGERIKEFLENNNQSVDFIASHGHTIFHQPFKGLTLQIGNGAVIAAVTGCTTVCDFRSKDVALGGQGAPLVPIGDKLLFSDFGFCLNLGGFANISFDNDSNARVAFDICPVNIIINYLVKDKGLELDFDGNIARQGICNDQLLETLNALSFYSANGPKSLGKEWLISEMIPVVSKYNISVEDKLRTVYEHVAFQISKVINVKQQTSILITGGGAHNKFLIEIIKSKTVHVVNVPQKDIIDYKEALLFAFLGVLRMEGNVNCLKSVTGACQDNIGGAVYLGL